MTRAGTAPEDAYYSRRAMNERMEYQMSTNILNQKIKELRELRRMADELSAEIEAIQDEIKAHMTAQDTDTLNGADWRITWKPVTSSRLDASALRKALPDVAAAFTKQAVTRRFILSA